MLPTFGVDFQATICRIMSDQLEVRLSLILLAKSAKTVCQNRLPKSSSKIIFQNRLLKPSSETVLPKLYCQMVRLFNDSYNMDYNSLSTHFACPFLMCRKTYSQKNKLKVHVAKARLKKGDDYYPENDHRWDNLYVQSLLVFGTHARTPAEKRQKRQERNKRYRRKNEWRQNLKVFSANTSGVCPFYKY